MEAETTEIYSKRKKMLERQGMPVLYGYDPLPEAFKNQVMYLWRDAVGSEYFSGFTESSGNPDWIKIIKYIYEEHGLPLSTNMEIGRGLELSERYLREAATDQALDLIEIVFRYVDKVVRDMEEYGRRQCKITIFPDMAIEKLNRRFLENHLGYQFTNWQIVRMEPHG